MKLNVMVGEALNGVVKRARIHIGGREKALETFVNLALADTGKYVRQERFDLAGSHNCTMKMSNSEYDATLQYRDQYGLETKKAFFVQAIKHGASLWDQQNPPPNHPVA